MKLLTLNSSLLNFCIYGLGSTGRSVEKYLKNKNFSNVKVWDDKIKTKREKKIFSKYLDLSDYIIISPGISLKSAKLKKKLIKNKNKIITDIDLFYLLNPNIKSIIITGTNGKSTTCKILEHVLKKNKINVKLGGNIGKPVLDLNLNGSPFVIIEASSFQLAYSKYIKPDYAAILNITNDHLEWHGSMKEYINSKLKIFSNQDNNNLAFLNNKLLIKKFKKNKYQSKLKYVNKKKYVHLQKKINNNYLRSVVNAENMSYIFEFSKVFKIKENNIVASLKSFRGLNHRHEIFYKKNNKIFINDSKATSFESSKFALGSNENIFWIVGGLPKVGDIFKMNKVKKNIIKAYIIGNYSKYFKKYFTNKIKFELSKNMKNAVSTLFKDIKKAKQKNMTILLSPASASYDQYKNFEERGNEFKKLIMKYAKKNI
tara:strand:+ start:1444 stop:2727 length:1284 start_codon:yes stop_codon:yes gene_type:complete